jgi:hypothetical protein
MAFLKREYRLLGDFCYSCIYRFLIYRLQGGIAYQVYVAMTALWNEIRLKNVRTAQLQRLKDRGRY